MCPSFTLHTPVNRAIFMALPRLGELITNCLQLCFKCNRLLPESVIWLYANNRIKEAEQIIRNAAKMNGITLPDNLLTSPTKSEGSQEEEEVKNGGFLAKIKSIKLCKRQKEEQPETARYTLLDVLRHRLLRMYAIIMSCLW